MTALHQLAAVMRLDQQAPADATGLAMQVRYAAATNAARALLANTAFEAGAFQRPGARRPIDAGVIAELDSVMLVLSVILNLRADPAWAEASLADRQAVLAYHAAMADWFDGCARWAGAGAAEAPVDTIPQPPVVQDTAELAARMAWYRLLDTRLHAIMGAFAQRDSVAATDGCHHG